MLVNTNPSATGKVKLKISISFDLDGPASQAILAALNFLFARVQVNSVKAKPGILKTQLFSFAGDKPQIQIVPANKPSTTPTTVSYPVHTAVSPHNAKHRERFTPPKEKPKIVKIIEQKMEQKCLPPTES